MNPMKPPADDEKEIDTPEKTQPAQESPDSGGVATNNKPAELVYSSSAAEEFAMEAQKKGLDLATVVSTGVKGITKGDIEKAIKAAGIEEEKEDSDNTDTDEPEVQTSSFNDILEKLISFGIPVRGALYTKPKVQEKWNQLIDKAVKLKNSQ